MVTEKDIKKIAKHVKKEIIDAKELKSEVRKNTLTAILAAFGFIIALVWRDAIQAGIDNAIAALGIEGTGYIFQLATTFLITIVCVAGIMITSKFKGKEDAKQ